MDREAWHAVIHGVAKSWIPLSDLTELNICLSVSSGKRNKIKISKVYIKL